MFFCVCVTDGDDGHQNLVLISLCESSCCVYRVHAQAETSPLYLQFSEDDTAKRKFG
jgi:hypothetical protein